MQRITDRDLEAVCRRINIITDSPLSPYVKDAETGRHVAQIGNYHISHAYGGVCLHRISNESGGITTPLNVGHVPKRELYHMMHAYIAGLTESCLGEV